MVMIYNHITMHLEINKGTPPLRRQMRGKGLAMAAGFDRRHATFRQSRGGIGLSEVSYCRKLTSVFLFSHPELVSGSQVFVLFYILRLNFFKI
jgi:hypothetical protein